MKRKLLFGERMLFGNGQTAFNVLTPVRIKGYITADELNYSLQRIQEKHPWLNACIKNDENGFPWFVIEKERQNKIPLRIVNRNSDDDWKTESVKEWSTVFDAANGPLIRLVWIKSDIISDLILVVHHCLCDGGAAMVILEELLQILDNADAEIGKEHPINNLSDIIPSNILNSKKKRIKARLIGGIATLILWLIPVKKKAIDRKTDYLIHWKLDENVSADLIRVSKMEGVTINTLLCSVVLSAFKQIRKEKAHNKITCPVDIRRFAPEIKKDQIFAYGLMLVVSAYASLDFIENAKALQKDIDKKMVRLNPYDTIMTMEAAHASLSKFSDFLKYGKSTNDCMFSNLGKIDIPYQYQKFEIETIFSPSVIGPLGNTTTLLTSTYRGQMDFSFIASEGFIPYQEALNIKDKIISLIKEQTAYLLQLQS
ncbi:condensation domain-containing protein [Mucilaginibacter sp.]|uniref:condensation domain-containing protein n=1 Tax=Mucilaginibacter sp. TaxID=1882438 RepID=UPI00261071DD|nr:condensation domain-containing protein [Mucilaginibacter sp.]MDB4923257.1 hypothetical protein [Mucilaginibacter sp.]